MGPKFQVMPKIEQKSSKQNLEIKGKNPLGGYYISQEDFGKRQVQQGSYTLTILFYFLMIWWLQWEKGFEPWTSPSETSEGVIWAKAPGDSDN